MQIAAPVAGCTGCSGAAPPSAEPAQAQPAPAEGFHSVLRNVSQHSDGDSGDGDSGKDAQPPSDDSQNVVLALMALAVTPQPQQAPLALTIGLPAEPVAEDPSGATEASPLELTPRADPMGMETEQPPAPVAPKQPLVAEEPEAASPMPAEREFAFDAKIFDDESAGAPVSTPSSPRAEKEQAAPQHPRTIALAKPGEQPHGNSNGPAPDKGGETAVAKTLLFPHSFASAAADARPAASPVADFEARVGVARQVEAVRAVEDLRSASPVRDISLRLAGESQSSAHVRMVDRGGEVQVSVRAASPDLAQNLRGNLNELMHRLEGAGMRAEVWGSVKTAEAGLSDTGQEEKSASDSQQGRDTGRNHGRRHTQDPRQWVEEMEDAWTA
ncbi:MAG: hypothetical protein HYR60_28555 [Acidobacteria bacterium]|nr:hypothetical protein [Acidobacteriota bacterium]